MTAPTGYRRDEPSKSRVVKLPYGDLTPGGIDVHVWRPKGSHLVNLNLETYDTDNPAQDIVAQLSIDNARALVLALSAAVDDAVERKLEDDAIDAAQRDAAELTLRRGTAPVVGDVVLIGPDPSGIWPTDRPGDGSPYSNLKRDFGGSWGVVEIVNYDFGHGGTSVSASELRAYVRVGKDESNRGMARWIHVDYLTPVAVMARTRVTESVTETTVTARGGVLPTGITGPPPPAYPWLPEVVAARPDEGFGVF